VDHTARTVAVTGATGRQGGAVTAHLLREGWRVRALTRDPESKAARRLAALGAGLVRADLADTTTLVPAFRDCHGVYSVQNPMVSGLAAEFAQGRNVADAAKAAGVPHLVYGSAGPGRSGTGVGSWESKLRVEAHMRELELPLTVLRPTAFMELMSDPAFFPATSAWSVMPKLTGEDLPVFWISVDDLGAIAAKVFADPDRFIGADLRLAADVQSIRECREIWREVTGRAPHSIPMPVWLFERLVGGDRGTDLTTMWRWLRTANLAVDPAETRKILPTAATVREWLLDRHPA
jgi:uncharacterized protein YbjT (DUF2867 family)